MPTPFPTTPHLRRVLLVLAALVGHQPAALASPGARPTPAPPEAAILIASPARLAAITTRLTGHRFRTGDHVLLLEDAAGDGRPWIGLVAARCNQLWLDTALGPLLLTGPLARPRIAGPGYLVWATGHRTAGTLALSRLGVLARPDELDAVPGKPSAEPPCP